MATWILITDRKPEGGARVLIVDDLGTVIIGWVDAAGEWWTCEDGEDDGHIWPIYWMPLPSPPDETEEGSF